MRLVGGAALAAAMLVGAPPSRAQGGALTGTLVVVNRSDGTVSLVDLASKAITATIPIGEGPHEVAVSPDGKLAAVSNYGSARAPGATLSLVDIAEGTAHPIDLGGHRRPHGVAWTPDGGSVLVTTETDSALLVVDPRAGAVTAVIRLAQSAPDLLALSADGARAYVTALGASSVTVVDLAAKKVVASATLPKNADGVAVRPGSDEVWVTSPASERITVLGAADLAERATIPAPGYPMRLRFTPDGATALALLGKASQLAFIDGASRKQSATTPMRVSKAAMRGVKFAEGYENATAPLGIALSPDGAWAFVTMGAVDAVGIVSVPKRDMQAVVFVGREPDGVGYTPLVRAPSE